MQAAKDQLFLQFTEGFEFGGNGIKGDHHPVAQLCLHGRDRGTCAVIELVLAVLALGAHFAAALRLTARLGLRRRNGVFFGHQSSCRTHDTAIGLFKIDHFAQQDAPRAQLFAPNHDGFKGQGAFAQTPDHGVAASLDALGNGDFALAR